MGSERENVHCHLWLCRSTGGCQERTLTLGSDSPVNCSWLIININFQSYQICMQQQDMRYEGVDLITQWSNAFTKRVQ